MNTFDLQLFAEDAPATPEAADTPQEDAQPAEGTGEAAEAGQEAETPSAPDVAVRVNPETGRRELVTAAKEETEEEPPITAPEPYTSDQLISAMTAGTVDETRIPESLRANYVAIRQQAQLAAQQQQIAAQQARLAQAQATQIPPQQDIQAQQVQAAQAQHTAVYTQIQQAAEEKALQDLGIKSKEALDEMEYSDDPAERQKAQSFKVAVDMNVQQLARRVEDYQQLAMKQRAEAAEVVGKIRPMYAKIVAEEPNFDKIDVKMGEYYKELPYNQAVEVKAAIDRFLAHRPLESDIPVLKDYYAKTRAAWYAERGGVPQTPRPVKRTAVPHVEQTGASATTVKAPVNWRAMRNMDARERSEFLRSHL